MLNKTKKELEDLKTEVASLKIRLRRVERYLLSLSSPGYYIQEENTSDDELFEEAKKIVQGYDRVSASLLQRRLSIGYLRAVRILDQLEAVGVVGPAEGSKPRDVLKNTEEKINNADK